ncbi:MAG: GMC oxidoreductase [Paracoccaceae bacterium]
MMFDLDKIEQLPSKNYTVTIIGSGIAGITLALELEKKFDNILVLETGSLDITTEKQDEHGGLTKNYGILVDHGEKYLNNVHQRWFGGTSHWAGVSSPFDQIDFEKRKYIECPEWDINYDEYYKFIPRAAKYAALENSDFKKISKEFLNYPELFNNDTIFKKCIEKVSLEPSFHDRFLHKVKKSKNITCILNASVTDCDFNFKEKFNFKSIIFKNNNLKEFHVSSNRYVLCMGSAENVRFLLNINKKHKINVGNHSNRLGKFFMEHLWISDFGYGYRYSNKFKNKFSHHTENGTHLVFRMEEEAQKKHKIHNNRINIASSEILNQEEISKLSSLDKKIIKLIDRNELNYYLWKDTFNFRSEIPPNEKNFFYLSKKLDKFGRNKVNLVWGCDSELKEKYKTFMKLFAQDYAIQTGGRFRILLPSSSAVWEDVSSGAHLIGTTPIALDYKKGVVNTNLRIHNTSNVYIAGSSVFPSSGGNTPTMNIIALTIRLADHLINT